MNSALVLSSILLWVVVLFNLLLTIALIRKSSTTQPGFDMAHIPTLEVGSQAPDFTAVTLDGKRVTPASYVEKSVAFVFVSPSCPPCVEKIPILNALGPQAEYSGVELILVNTTDIVDAEAFVQQHDIKLSMLVAPRNINPFADDYKATSTPFYCLVSGDSIVESTGLLDTKWDQLTSRWGKNAYNQVSSSVSIKSDLSNIEISREDLT